MSKTLRLTWFVAAVTLVPALAHAQLSNYRPGDPAVGERYNVELAVGFWYPTPAITISSTSLSMIGSEIDAVKDLGFAQTRLTDVQLVVRPAKKHKIRFEYLPVKYSADATMTRNIVFHGATYPIGVPVTSQLDWKAYRFGYEYDILYRTQGFIGVVGHVMYANVQASVATTLPAPLPNVSASTEQKEPVPGIGGIARGYLAQNVSITGELTGFKLPQNATNSREGTYLDFDLYGTFNFHDSVGAQAGYRWMDVKYSVPDDSGKLKLKGFYFRGVVRF